MAIAKVLRNYQTLNAKRSEVHFDSNEQQIKIEL